MAKPKKKDVKKPKKPKKAKPEQPSCDCRTTQTFFATTEALRMTPGTRILRYAVTVGSLVVCDPKTPGHCQYNYSVSVAIQARDVDRRRTERVDEDARAIRSSARA